MGARPIKSGRSRGRGVGGGNADDVGDVIHPFDSEVNINFPIFSPLVIQRQDPGPESKVTKERGRRGDIWIEVGPVVTGVRKWTVTLRMDEALPSENGRPREPDVALLREWIKSIIAHDRKS